MLMTMHQYGRVDSKIILIFFLTIILGNFLSHSYCKRCRFSSNAVAYAFILHSQNYRISRTLQTSSLESPSILRITPALSSEVVNEAETEKLILWRYDSFLIFSLNALIFHMLTIQKILCS